MGTIRITEEELDQAILNYFSEPEITDCFTIARLARLRHWGRTKAENAINQGITDGEIEFVAEISGAKYYRFKEPKNWLESWAEVE